MELALAKEDALKLQENVNAMQDSLETNVKVQKRPFRKASRSEISTLVVNGFSK